MRSTSVWSMLALAGLLGLGVAGCSEGGTGVPTGGGEITVVVQVDGAGQSGVTTSLLAAGRVVETAQTGSSGQATFTGLDAGPYEVEISVPGGFLLGPGETARKSLTLGPGGEATVRFNLVENAADGDVVEVHLTSSNLFSPADVTISAGTTVRWVNDIARFHTVTPDGHTEWSRQTLSAAGETFEHTFDGTGTFPYFCEPHQGAGMTGTITVQ